jgi:hypothetical protein
MGRSLAALLQLRPQRRDLLLQQFPSACLLGNTTFRVRTVIGIAASGRIGGQ